tara:strand:- start:598 stop:1158 length:561 start_codon:yes stop_codon:yes gene_type:complete
MGVLGLLLAGAPAALAAPPVVWEDIRSAEGSLRRGDFVIADGDCAYRVMADPIAMGNLLRHVKKVDVHAMEGGFQDVSIHESFFLVGRVESRYHRQVNGVDRLEWRLIAGRQQRHDGFWQVKTRPQGGATVVFENLIKAKYRIHQGLLRRIQERTMNDIVSAVLERCGGSSPRPAKESLPSHAGPS